mmetsp:Transcript_18076/g.27866  ORF Transcript_18076/g.27866 Transcript_18076/m.27866 type:complete len:105 (+) Transcript_18076:428-742(+)
MKFKPTVEKKKGKSKKEKQQEQKQQAKGEAISKYCEAVVNTKVYSKISSHPMQQLLITNNLVQGYLLPRLLDIRRGATTASMHGLAGDVKSYRVRESEQFKKRK